MNTTDIQIQLRSAERNLWAVLATIVFSLLACAAANAQTQEGWSKLKGDVNHKVDADKAAGFSPAALFFSTVSPSQTMWQ